MIYTSDYKIARGSYENPDGTLNKKLLDSYYDDGLSETVYIFPIPPSHRLSRSLLLARFKVANDRKKLLDGGVDTGDGSAKL